MQGRPFVPGRDAFDIETDWEMLGSFDRHDEDNLFLAHFLCLMFYCAKKYPSRRGQQKETPTATMRGSE
jgi:hypothetical protein